MAVPLTFTSAQSEGINFVTILKNIKPTMITMIGSLFYYVKAAFGGTYQRYGQPTTVSI